MGLNSSEVAYMPSNTSEKELLKMFDHKTSEGEFYNRHYSWLIQFALQ